MTKKKYENINLIFELIIMRAWFVARKKNYKRNWQAITFAMKLLNSFLNCYGFGDCT